MSGTRLHPVDCPYCGETIELVVDASVDHQDYVEDCSVCCRPMQIAVTVDGDSVLVVARDENDT